MTCNAMELVRTPEKNKTMKQRYGVFLPFKEYEEVSKGTNRARRYKVYADICTLSLNNIVLYM